MMWGCLPIFLDRGRYQAGQLDNQVAVVAIEDTREQPMEGLDAADILIRDIRFDQESKEEFPVAPSPPSGGASHAATEM